MCQDTGEIWCDGRRITVSHLLSRVLYRIMCGPGYVSLRELVEWVYADRIDSGPLKADSCVRRYVNVLRATFERHKMPIVIKTKYTFGYELRQDLVSELIEGIAA